MKTLITVLPPQYRRFARYFVSGGLASVTHYAILAAMVELGDIDETLSTAVGYTLSSILNYTLQYYWTFRSSVIHRKATLRFVAVATSTLGVNTGLFWIFLNVFGIWYLLAQAITTVLVLGLNYFLNSRYTFTRA